MLGGVVGSIFEIQECFVPQKSIFDLFGEKWPARWVTVKMKKGVCQFELLPLLVLVKLIWKENQDLQLFPIQAVVIMSTRFHFSSCQH